MWVRLGGFPGRGHGSPLQYSCLENPMDRGAWQATVHRVAKSQTRLKKLSMHTITCTHLVNVRPGSKKYFHLHITDRQTET